MPVYFLYAHAYEGLCEVVSTRDGVRGEAVLRDLSEFDIFVRQPQFVNILHKVMPDVHKNGPMSALLSADKEFGWTSNFNGFHDESQGVDDVPLYYVRKGKRLVGYIDRYEIKKSAHLVDTWKVMVPEASSDGGQRIPDMVLGKPLLAPSPSVCTQTFLFFYTDSKEQRDNICRYVQTKFFRFLVSTRKMTQHAPVEAYKWVPQQDFTADSDINWQQPIAAIDQQLYAKYQLSSEEVALIEARVKPMALD